jgi:hypothetical protein
MHTKQIEENSIDCEQVFISVESYLTQKDERNIWFWFGNKSEFQFSNSLLKSPYNSRCDDYLQNRPFSLKSQNHCLRICSKNGEKRFFEVMSE